MVDKSFVGENPIKSVTLLHAIRWSIQAWNEVRQQTVANCWRSSTLLGPAYGPQKRPLNWDEEESQLRERIKQLEETKVITNAPAAPESLNNFINPPEEQLQEPPQSAEELLQYCADLFAPEEPEDMNEELEQPVEVSVLEAAQALEKLRLFEEQQEDADQTAIELYNRMQGVFLRRKLELQAKTQKQVTLDGFFKPRGSELQAKPSNQN